MEAQSEPSFSLQFVLINSRNQFIIFTQRIVKIQTYAKPLFFGCRQQFLSPLADLASHLQPTPRANHLRQQYDRVHFSNYPSPLFAFVILCIIEMNCVLIMFWCLPNSVSFKVNGLDSCSSSISLTGAHFSYGGGPVVHSFLYSSLAFSKFMTSAFFTVYHCRSGNKSRVFLY